MFHSTRTRSTSFTHADMSITIDIIITCCLQVLDLIAYMRAGEYIYVQCSDGNGRSGTVCAILAGLAYGLGPVEALALMQKSRNDRPGAQGPSPETHDQRMQVHRLAL